SAAKLSYRWGIRPWLFRIRSPQASHEDILTLLAQLDNAPPAIFQAIQRLAFPKQEVHIGGVTLPYPVMLAAGFVKGVGFADENAALASTENIIPGWRTMPALVGAVEFGSFTRWPRLGNSGTVIWRDVTTQSTQNRIGLKNPGAKAAAAFLVDKTIPGLYGINVAVSPGVSDPDQEQNEVLETLAAFASLRQIGRASCRERV